MEPVFNFDDFIAAKERYSTQLIAAFPEHEEEIIKIPTTIHAKSGVIILNASYISKVLMDKIKNYYPSYIGDHS